MDQTPDDVFVVTQTRLGAGLVAVLGAVWAVAGVWGLLRLDAGTREWWLAAAQLTPGALLAAGALAMTLRPGALTVTPDGMNFQSLFRSRSVAWDEVSAIGHLRVSDRYGRDRVVGVQVSVLDGWPLELGASWPGGADATIALLTQAWQACAARPGETPISVLLARTPSVARSAAPQPALVEADREPARETESIVS